MESCLAAQGLNPSLEQGVKQQPESFITSKLLSLSVQWLVSADSLTLTLHEEGRVPCAALYN